MPSKCTCQPSIMHTHDARQRCQHNLQTLTMYHAAAAIAQQGIVWKQQAKGADTAVSVAMQTCSQLHLTWYCLCCCFLREVALKDGAVKIGFLGARRVIKVSEATDSTTEKSWGQCRCRVQEVPQLKANFFSRAAVSSGRRNSFCHSCTVHVCCSL
jgi:hypothetical protein